MAHMSTTTSTNTSSGSVGSGPDAQQHTTTVQSEFATPLVIGYSDPTLQLDAASALHAARQDSYDFVTTSLPDLTSLSSASTIVRADVTALQAQWWRTSVVGILSSLEQWPQQMPWVWHMNLPAVIVPALPENTEELAQYAQQLQALAQQALKEGGYSFQIWVPLPLTAKALAAWQFVSSMAKTSNVGLILKLEPTPAAAVSAAGATPDAVQDAARYSVAEQLHVVHNALGCGPVLAMMAPTHAFLTNRRGYPTLSKAHQWIAELVLQRVGRTIRWLVQGPSRINLTLPNRGISAALPYLQYLQHIRKRPAVSSVLDTSAAQDEMDYLDALQKPLQPLHDNLVFATYETFEKDPVKYKQYQAASRLGLMDKRQVETCHVLVVGAGRGPLVTGVLQAYLSLGADERSKTLKVIAVEKNPSAIVYLHSKLESEPLWKAVAQITIVQADLRDLTNDHCQTADIIVSELLGSFGCNELSPECLDPLLARCRPDTISIPSRYISHLAPVSSMHIHSHIVSQQAFYPDAEHLQAVGRQTAIETAYVVRTHAASQLYQEKDCWFFEHPSTTTTDRSRYSSMQFGGPGSDGLACGSGYGAVDDKCLSLPQTAEQSYVVTGLLGTFTAVLYKDCIISTAPRQYSVGMYSWFPLYFPLNEPLLVPAGAQLSTYMWRKVDATRVWYEWSAAVMLNSQLLATTPVHNPGGRSYHVELS